MAASRGGGGFPKASDLGARRGGSGAWRLQSSLKRGRRGDSLPGTGGAQCSASPPMFKATAPLSLGAEMGFSVGVMDMQIGLNVSTRPSKGKIPLLSLTAMSFLPPAALSSELCLCRTATSGLKLTYVVAERVLLATLSTRQSEALKLFYFIFPFKTPLEHLCTINHSRSPHTSPGNRFSSSLAPCLQPCHRKHSIPASRE